MYYNGKGTPQDYIRAHMWWNLAASGNPEFAEARDGLTKWMTASDVSKAQMLASECIKKNYKGC
jgi:TPR repeat protein